MYNWSTNEKELAKNPGKYGIWKLEQMIDYGAGGEKIKISELKLHWDRISIDPYRRKFLKLLLGERNTY
ncbi:MAG: hypothetical protein A3B99_02605 [Candidatus Yanofskybacteria bacterium RIFCSPHIGHO2_02_FULL_44_12b]|uniref:Uncharacterized protein n=1 Tax=Candidatus Yanofskybacteria bacterium RIFCSPLOWO2_01_FULL_44_22 TaxID=1802697 RepID=A0A1F8GKW9_9BACT|nr:MAG: hypothetical protein A2659_00225 [Candidatus Yanofskybacteria bacterium RIFCSPHIGHO2_01_FULL_44_24]OGN15357.1 MAG: hypothetical protein A3B99_02605 [Candidatus Yanofskybacteria bacterium RIFCSPHIGHO2_02_FULL_44_12b]OGN25983.1 MAG: hypothetical protein A2925_04605 [Candidatus Yanofskybacteria bacterium RIFCSPLOWO2_01_FULL_44_22]